MIPCCLQSFFETCETDAYFLCHSLHGQVQVLRQKTLRGFPGRKLGLWIVVVRAAGIAHDSRSRSLSLYLSFSLCALSLSLSLSLALSHSLSVLSLSLSALSRSFSLSSLFILLKKLERAGKVGNLGKIDMEG